MKRRIAGPIAALLVLAAPALAQEAAPGSQSAPQGGAPQAAPHGARAPLDLATFQARSRTRLMRADTNGDGRIDMDEWKAWQAAHPGKDAGKAPADPEKRFHRLDANGDGVLTPNEIDARSAKRFARLDADHDGRLTRAERSHGTEKPQ